MAFRSDQIHRVDDHPDVGRVLAGVAPLRNVDQLDRGFVELPLVLGETGPVRVSLLEDDPPLLDQPLQDEVDVEFLVLRVAHAESDVLEVDEEREPLLDGGSRREERPGADDRGRSGRRDRCGGSRERDRNRYGIGSCAQVVHLSAGLAPADSSPAPPRFLLPVSRLGGREGNGLVAHRAPPGR